MGYEIVDEGKENVWSHDGSPFRKLVVGADNKALELTVVMKVLFPEQFEELRGDADYLFIESMYVSAEEVLEVEYTRCNDTCRNT